MNITFFYHKPFTSTLCYNACSVEVLHCTGLKPLHALFPGARTLPLPRTYMRHAHLLSLAAWVFEKHLEPGLPRLCFTFYLSRFEQGVEFLDSIFPCKHLSIALPGRLSDLFCEPLPDLTSFLTCLFTRHVFKNRFVICFYLLASSDLPSLPGKNLPRLLRPVCNVVCCWVFDSTGFDVFVWVDLIRI